MNHLTKYLEPFLLQPVEFVINDKVVRRGRIRVFNFRQYFIKFMVETDSGDLKVYDVLYPFKITNEGDKCVFNYHLSCFSDTNVEMFYKMKTTNKEKYLPTYDSLMILKPMKK